MTQESQGSTGKADADIMREEETLDAAEVARRRAVREANDDADASHQGGMGSQGGQVDFGNPKNFGT
ncbi:MAG: hypothetical protein JWM38_2122 [Sphingomonas bacterium]|jgi:hypothetical protein|nr:hypothetical protein [Sphingomonas bacterium]MDB5718695.1 hypothetical protein [Sphingomonas bacterium]